MDKQKVTLDILTERPVIRNDIPSELDIVIEVRSEQEDSEVRTTKALNLCVVIDRSGSMSGGKLDTAKKSCIDIFNRLDEDDLLTVVVFDNTAEVIVNPSVPRDEIPDKINAISTGGSTNLSLGWYLGLLELQTHGTDQHYNRLMLLSDGQANAGETKITVLTQEATKARDKGITTSTIGIGDRFQEDILQAIALESGGRFWYIQESRMEDIIRAEFQGALSVIIDRPRIELSLPDGVTVAKELNVLSKLTERYRIRPITGQFVFNFAVRLAINPEQIDGDITTLTSALYDGDEQITNTELEMSLVPFDDYVTSDENMVVASVVQQYQSAISDEEMIAKMDEGDFAFVNQMLVEEVGGMRKAVDKIEHQRQQERLEESEKLRLEREKYRMEIAMREKETRMIISKLLDIASSAPNSKYQRELEYLTHSIRKHARRDAHFEHHRHYSPEFYGEMESIDFLQGALLVLDEMVADYPDRTEFQDTREQIREQLEKYQ